MWKLFQLSIVCAVVWGCEQLGISQGNEPADVLLGLIAAAAATALLSDIIHLLQRGKRSVDARELKLFVENPKRFENLNVQQKERALQKIVKQLAVGTRVCVSDRSGKSFGTITRVDQKRGETFSVYWDEECHEVGFFASHLEHLEFV